MDNETEIEKLQRAVDNTRENYDNLALIHNDTVSALNRTWKRRNVALDAYRDAARALRKARNQS